MSVDDEIVGAIDRGLVAFVGVSQDDAPSDAEAIANKLLRLRIFEDAEGKMNLAVSDVQGAGILLVSQFTLLGDCRRGNRPSFTAAAAPEHALPLFERVVAHVAHAKIPHATGRFGADMRVRVENDGPVTMLLDSRRAF